MSERSRFTIAQLHHCFSDDWRIVRYKENNFVNFAVVIYTRRLYERNIDNEDCMMFSAAVLTSWLVSVTRFTLLNCARTACHLHPAIEHTRDVYCAFTWICVHHGPRNYVCTDSWYVLLLGSVCSRKRRLSGEQYGCQCTQRKIQWVHHT